METRRAVGGALVLAGALLAVGSGDWLVALLGAVLMAGGGVVYYRA